MFSYGLMVELNHDQIWDCFNSEHLNLNISQKSVTEEILSFQQVVEIEKDLAKKSLSVVLNVLLTNEKEVKRK